MTEANGDVTSYTYDNVYRLTDETKRDSGDNVLYRYQYTYDGVGNRLTENNTGVITYSYDANNKLTQLVGPSGTTTFGYDGNGNTTSMTQPGPVVTTYGYDYENRLASVTNPSYTAAYTYAADGLRLRVQESNNPNPDRWMQYDGVRPVLEGTLDSQGVFTTLNKYVWEGNGYYDALVYSLIGGAWRYHLYDGLGSTRQLLQHLSPYAVTDTYSYEAFGNLLSSTGSTPNPYRYVGSLGYYATGSSLMHLGARYYMPEVGRFTSVDAGFGSAQYQYGDNNPLGFTDPEGLLAKRPHCDHLRKKIRSLVREIEGIEGGKPSRWNIPQCECERLNNLVWQVGHECYDYRFERTYQVDCTDPDNSIPRADNGPGLFDPRPFPGPERPPDIHGSPVRITPDDPHE